MNDYFNMELWQAFNPLYVVPVGAVIVCAFIVYFFGFKSPVQPSFEGIEGERKVNKKRRAKETKNKSLQNGKLNEHALQKTTNVPPAKKKETHEKQNVEKPSADKPNTDKQNTEKPNAEKHSAEKHNAEKHRAEKQAIHHEKTNKNTEKGESKAAKKARIQNEMLETLAKTEAVIQDDLNDDGWIQLISKRRKNRKKEEASPKSESEVKPVKVPPPKKVEIDISDPAALIMSLQNNDDIEISFKDAKAQRKNKQAKGENKKEYAAENEAKDKKVENVAKDKKAENVAKDKKAENVGKDKKAENVGKDKKAENVGKNKKAENEGKDKKAEKVGKDKKAEKDGKDAPVRNQTPPEKKAVESNPIATPDKVSSDCEETKSKSKKKKKKSPESISKDNASGVKAGEPPAVQDLKEKEVEVTISAIKPPRDNDLDKKEENPPSEIKATNVVFDELAGLYPEEKEQKKRKKVRRDH